MVLWAPSASISDIILELSKRELVIEMRIDMVVGHREERLMVSTLAVAFPVVLALGPRSRHTSVPAADKEFSSHALLPKRDILICWVLLVAHAYVRAGVVCHSP